MKYTLSINQKIIIEGGHPLDITDCAILETMDSMQGAEGIVKIIYNNTGFYWMAHQKLCDELPILRIKKDSMYRRIKKLIEKKYVIPHPQNKALKATYYRVTNRAKSLFYNFATTSEKNPIPIGNKSELTSDENPKDNNTNYNNTNYNNTNYKKKKDVTTNASLFVAPADLVLKKYLNSDSFLLRLPDQPSLKVLNRWSEIYDEAYLQRQFLKAEKYFKNKKNSAKKIKSISRTLNEFLKKEWISDEKERKVLKVFRDWHEKNFSLPMQFDFYPTSADRLQLSLYSEGMTEAGRSAENCLQRLLNNLPTFWKGKKLSSILKNYINISNDIESKGKQSAPRNFQNKQSATVEDFSWMQSAQN